MQLWRPGRKPGLWPGRRRRAGRVGRLFGWRVCGEGALPSRSSRRPGPWWRRVGMVTMKLGLFKEERCGCSGGGECVLCAFRASVWIRPQSNDVDVRTTLWSPFLERGGRNGPAFTIESWQCKIRRHMRSAWTVWRMARAYITLTNARSRLTRRVLGHGMKRRRSKRARARQNCGCGGHKGDEKEPWRRCSCPHDKSLCVGCMNEMCEKGRSTHVVRAVCLRLRCFWAGAGTRSTEEAHCER